jgi:anti-sigma factor RsiW
MTVKRDVDDIECEKMLSRLIELHMGELPDDEAVLLHQHLAECCRCQAEDRALGELRERLGKVPTIEPSEAVHSSLRRCLEVESACLPPLRWWGWIAATARRRVPLYGAAAAVVLIAVGFLGGIRLAAGREQAAVRIFPPRRAPLEEPTTVPSAGPGEETRPAPETMLSREGVEFTPSPNVRLAFGLERVRSDSI